MRPKSNTSAYSKMYLVSTPVYNKLLSCLDEVDKQSTIDINKDVEPEEIRPSNKVLDNLNNIQQPVVEDVTQHQQQQPMPINVVDEDRHIDEIVDDNIGQNNIPQLTIPTENQVVSETSINNKLQTPCANNNNINQQIKKKIRMKPIVSDAISSISSPIKKSTDNYDCTICGKKLARKWGLTRHMQTIHKKEPSETITSNNSKFSKWDNTQVQNSDDDLSGEDGEDEEDLPRKGMKPNNLPMDYQVNIPQFSGKRSAVDAKLPHLIAKRRSTRVIKKSRNGDGNSNFESWNVK